MSTKEIKAQIHHAADRVEDGVEAAASALGNGVDALGAEHGELQRMLRDLGQRVRESTKALTDEATRQARLRPLAVFGLAFLAGVVAARALRR